MAEFALLDAAGYVLRVIVVDENDAASVAVLETAVAAKEGPLAAVRATERVDLRLVGFDRPGPGAKRRADGAWRTDEREALIGKLREYRDGDEPGKPTGALLDGRGLPRPGTELPAVSGKPAAAGQPATPATP